MLQKCFQNAVKIAALNAVKMIPKYRFVGSEWRNRWCIGVDEGFERLESEASGGTPGVLELMKGLNG